MSMWRGIDLPGALLVALLSAAAGHALARSFEKELLNWLVNPVWHLEDAQGFRLEVAPIGFPEWQGSQGFIVRRIPEEKPGKD